MNTIYSRDSKRRTAAKTGQADHRVATHDDSRQPSASVARRREKQVAAFDLSWHLPHLLRRAHFEAEARFAEVYGDVATSRQLALLVALAQVPGATQAAVARSIGLDANTCSDLVRRTCAKGLIERRRGRSDARAYALELTAAGRSFVFESALPLAEPYSERIAERLTPKQRQTLERLLRVMLGLHAGSMTET